ncbi:hypothetical protein AYL99_11867 [Fonsecaea erecta]|uniref:Uncharacterized protein n=1 Tax=Fonsecaea erecta TaxID=1367422 RepID=A0A178Z2P2_9EURO|nr:hypothetical protein AYL99_11867 [Fonsecaea erecta]OAP53987.1 hypothetical protein AYL99_11867 [Fonsecaea erecta]
MVQNLGWLALIASIGDGQQADMLDFLRFETCSSLGSVFCSAPRHNPVWGAIYLLRGQVSVQFQNSCHQRRQEIEKEESSDRRHEAMEIVKEGPDAREWYMQNHDDFN